MTALFYSCLCPKASSSALVWIDRSTPTRAIILRKQLVSRISQIYGDLLETFRRMPKPGHSFSVSFRNVPHCSHTEVFTTTSGKSAVVLNNARAVSHVAFLSGTSHSGRLSSVHKNEDWNCEYGGRASVDRIIRDPPEHGATRECRSRNMKDLATSAVVIQNTYTYSPLT